MKNFLYFQWFLDKYKTETGGFINFDSFYLNDDLSQGQLLWVPEESYQIGFLTSEGIQALGKHLDKKLAKQSPCILCAAKKNKRRILRPFGTQPSKFE